MIRQELLEALAIVKPALLTQETVPILTHYWFDGKNVSAFDDKIMISTACKTDFVGALPGKTLTDLLESTLAEKVTMVEEDAGVRIKATSTNMKLAMLPASDFKSIMEQMPKSIREAIPIKRREQLVESLKGCTLSVGDDSNKPEQMGIKFLPDDRYMVAYASNSITLSRADIALSEKCNLPEEGRIVPGSFCRLVASYVEASDDTFELEIGDEYGMFVSGKVTIFCRLINPPINVDFPGILDHHFPAKRQKEAIPVPSELRQILEAACVIINTKLDGSQRMYANVKAGVAAFDSKSAKGEVHSSLQLDKHPDIVCSCDPRPLLSAYEFYARTDDKGNVLGRILFTPQCVVMLRDDMTFLVSAFSS